MSFSDLTSPSGSSSISEEVDINYVNEAKKNLINEFKTPLIKSINSLEMRDKMKVYLRIRPYTKNEKSTGAESSCVTIKDTTAVDMCRPIDPKSSKHNKLSETHRFLFSKVYDQETDQQSLFKSTTLKTVEQFVGGQNCLTFCYGVTNSGKTYTVQGTAENPGVIPRAMDVLFNSCGNMLSNIVLMKPYNYSDVMQLSAEQSAKEFDLKNSLLKLYDCNKDDNHSKCSDGSFNKTCLDISKRLFSNLENRIRESEIVKVGNPNAHFSIWVSFAEIYNENIYDLFENMQYDSRSKLRMAEDKNGNIYIKGLQEVNVQTADEACRLLYVGQKNLKIAATKLNQNSSRSHCIFSIRMVAANPLVGTNLAKVSKLSFCDLAGSERSAKTKNTGIRLKETANINTSLMVLGRCMNSLRHNQCHRDKLMVPYRDSKLTRLFQNFFTGRGLALMIVNISPSTDFYDETMHALRFSAIAQEVVSLTIRERIVKTMPSKLSIALAQVEDPRLTIAWEEGKASYCPSNGRSSEEADEYVSETESDPDTSLDEEVGQIEQLTKVIDKLKEALRNSLQEKANLERVLRKEFAAELAKHLSRTENEYETRMQEKTLKQEEFMESRMELMKTAVENSRKRARYDDEYLEMEERLEKCKNVDQIENKLKEVENDKHNLKENLTELQFRYVALETQVKELKEEREKHVKENVNASIDSIDVSEQTMDCDQVGETPPKSDTSILFHKVNFMSGGLSNVNRIAQSRLDHARKKVDVQSTDWKAESDRLEALVQNLEEAKVELENQITCVKEKNEVKFEGLQKTIEELNKDNRELRRVAVGGASKIEIGNLKERVEELKCIEFELRVLLRESKVKCKELEKKSESLVEKMAADKSKIVEKREVETEEDKKLHLRLIFEMVKDVVGRSDLNEPTSIEEAGLLLKEEWAEFACRLQKKTDGVDVLHKEIEELRTKCDGETLALREECQELKGEVESLKKESDRLKQENEHVRVKALDLLFSTENKKRGNFEDVDVYVLMEEIKEAVLKLSNDVVEGVKMRQTMEQLKNEITVADDDVKVKNDRINAMNEVLVTQDKTLADQDQKIGHLTKELEAEIKMADERKAVIEKQTNDINQLKLQLKETTTDRKKRKNSDSEANDDSTGNENIVEISASTSRPKRNLRNRKVAIDETALTSMSDEEYMPQKAATTGKKKRPAKGTKTPLSKILALVNAPASNFDSAETERSETTTTGGKQSKRKRKLFKNDISEPFMCTPPIVSMETERQSPRTTVNRRLRHRKL